MLSASSSPQLHFWTSANVTRYLLYFYCLLFDLIISKLVTWSKRHKTKSLLQSCFWHQYHVSSRVAQLGLLCKLWIGMPSQMLCMLCVPLWQFLTFNWCIWNHLWFVIIVIISKHIIFSGLLKFRIYHREKVVKHVYMCSSPFRTFLCTRVHYVVQGTSAVGWRCEAIQFVWARGRCCRCRHCQQTRCWWSLSSHADHTLQIHCGPKKLIFSLLEQKKPERSVAMELIPSDLWSGEG